MRDETRGAKEARLQASRRLGCTMDSVNPVIAKTAVGKMKGNQGRRKSVAGRR